METDTLIHCAKELANLSFQMEIERVEYEKKTASLRKTIEKLKQRESLLMLGFNADKIERARNIIRVRGKLSDAWIGRGSISGDRREKLVEECKTDIANGGEKIWKEFFGIKNYDSFGDQRCDCAYGYGPRHGSIVFEIGLTNERRKSKEPLSDEEIEDALYYLNALRRL